MAFTQVSTVLYGTPLPPAPRTRTGDLEAVYPS